MRIIPFHLLTKTYNKGYRDSEPLLKSHPEIEIVKDINDADFVFYWSWGDDPKIMVDFQAETAGKPWLADITGDHCWIPNDAKGLFFTTCPNYASSTKQFEVPYSYRFLSRQRFPLPKPAQKYLASFQGSMKTNPKRLNLLRYQAPDIFIKEQDGWGLSPSENQRVLAEHEKLLLESKFTFCPVGIGRSSIRLVEAIFAGSIPITIGDHSKPFEQQLDFCVPGDDKYLLNPEWLRKMPVAEYLERLARMASFRDTYLLRDAHKDIYNDLGYLDWIYEKAMGYE
jgi:hypothetical protein